MLNIVSLGSSTRDGDTAGRVNLLACWLVVADQPGDIMLRDEGSRGTISYNTSGAGLSAFSLSMGCTFASGLWKRLESPQGKALRRMRRYSYGTTSAGLCS